MYPREHLALGPIGWEPREMAQSVSGAVPQFPSSVNWSLDGTGQTLFHQRLDSIC